MNKAQQICVYLFVLSILFFSGNDLHSIQTNISCGDNHYSPETKTKTFSGTHKVDKQDSAKPYMKIRYRGGDCCYTLQVFAELVLPVHFGRETNGGRYLSFHLSYSILSPDLRGPPSSKSTISLYKGLGEV